MSYFKSKMHQIRFRLGLRPNPAGGAYSAPPNPLAGFKGPTSKGKGRGKEGKEREWYRDWTPSLHWEFLATPLLVNARNRRMTWLRYAMELTKDKKCSEHKFHCLFLCSETRLSSQWCNYCLSCESCLVVTWDLRLWGVWLDMWHTHTHVLYTAVAPSSDRPIRMIAAP